MLQGRSRLKAAHPLIKNNRGISLIESMIALGILSVLVIVATQGTQLLATMKKQPEQDISLLNFKREMYSLFKDPYLCTCAFQGTTIPANRQAINLDKITLFSEFVAYNETNSTGGTGCERPIRTLAETGKKP